MGVAEYVQRLLERARRYGTTREGQARRAAREAERFDPERDHLTTDRSDPRLGYGSDDEPVPQNEAYLVLPEEERAKGFVRPVRLSYRHVRGPNPCGATTTMGRELAETYARDPSFYGATYCVTCSMHRPVSEFDWSGSGDQVGS